MLRRKPLGPLLPSAHAIEREYRVLQALHGGPVPVADPVLLCEDVQVIGSAFYLMDYVDGRVFWDPSLPGFAPAKRARLYDEMNRVAAAIHGLWLVRYADGPRSTALHKRKTSRPWRN